MTERVYLLRPPAEHAQFVLERSACLFLLLPPCDQGLDVFWLESLWVRKLVLELVEGSARGNECAQTISARRITAVWVSFAQSNESSSEAWHGEFSDWASIWAWFSGKCLGPPCLPGRAVAS